MASIDKVTLFLITFMSPAWLNCFDCPGLFVWNVGQGQWVTEITTAECLHFDAGGEKSATPSVEPLCRFRLNKVYLSHWDWDHISFATELAQFPRVCLASLPRGFANESKRQLIDHFQLCNSPEQEKILYTPPTNMQRNKANDNSTVFRTRHFLITGDLPKPGELQLAKTKDLSMTRVLLVGHHGSRTSSSDLFLGKLVNLKMAIASQRRKKYGHPHKEVVEAFRKKAVPLIKTEDWGNLFFRE